MRAQLSALEDDQKRRATRSLRDGIDRVLTDLESMFRDVLMLQFGRDDELINRELEPELRALAGAWSAERTLTVVDRIAETRRNARAERRAHPRPRKHARDRRERKDPVNRLLPASRPARRRRRSRAWQRHPSLLSGCLYSLIPDAAPASTASPTPDTEGVAAELLPFYGQTLDWDGVRRDVRLHDGDARRSTGRTRAAGEIELVGHPQPRRRAARRSGRC